MKTNQGIQSTKDYSIFSTIEGNREIKNQKLARLTLSVMSNNMLAVNPIIVNNKMQVIDGQHRLEVAKANSLEIYYVTLSGGAIDNIIALNSNITPWNTVDFINSYAVRGNKNYQWILQFMADYHISPTVARYLIYGYEGGGNISLMWQSGKLVVTEAQKKMAEDRADVLFEVRPYLSRKGTMPKATVFTLIKLHDEGLSKTLIANLKKSGQAIVPKATVHESEAQFRRLV